jgi:hypothetical protein
VVVVVAFSVPVAIAVVVVVVDPVWKEEVSDPTGIRQ